MARQNGIVVLKGTIEGLNFYIRKGEPLVRKAGGGFDGEAIKKKASMVRVRENGSEFGACTKAVKQFKMSLTAFLSQFRDGSSHQRLVQLFSQIKNLDEVSLRGERNVHQGLLTAAGREKLLGYVVTPGIGIAEALGNRFEFGWGAAGFTIADFLASRVLFPKGAAHIELKVGYLLIDFEHKKHSFSQSDPLIIEKNTSETSVQILPTIVPEGNGFKIGVVFLRFMQEVNGTLYPFKELQYTALEVVYVESPSAG